MGAYMRRLVQCEKLLAKYRRLVAELTRQLRAAQQSLNDQRGT